MCTEEASIAIVIARAELYNRDIKDFERIECAIHDGTLQIVGPNCDADQKKTAKVKASKQHFVGMIVGKRGTNIMPKREETKTDVQNPQQDDPQSKFRVTGNSYKELLDMCLWILRQDDRLSGKDICSDSQKIEAKIWCCSKYVGLLVGPNGETIRGIKDNSRCCSIQSPPRNEKDKYFAVTGSSEEIRTAFELMWKMIEQKYSNDNIYINTFKTCDCYEPCKRLRLILNKTTLTPTTPSATSRHPTPPYDKVSFTAPYSYPADIWRSPTPSCQPSPTIKGSCIFTGNSSSPVESPGRGSVNPFTQNVSFSEGTDELDTRQWDVDELIYLLYKYNISPSSNAAINPYLSTINHAQEAAVNLHSLKYSLDNLENSRPRINPNQYYNNGMSNSAKHDHLNQTVSSQLKMRYNNNSFNMNHHHPF